MIIFEKDNITHKILGKQKFLEKTNYRLLHFCIIKKIQNDYVIYNNLNKKMLTLSKPELAAIKSLPGIPDKLLLPLIEDWFLVPVENNDSKLSDQIHEIAKLYNNDTAITNYVILTTTDCNARCFYCYALNVFRVSMDNQTASDVADYIIKASNGKKVSIKWFGGEPLYNLDAIDTICRKLSNKVEFKSSMTTNGYLFNKELILHAKEKWDLKRLQITLDGTEKIYNKTKAYIYKDCTNPFKRVIDNIKTLIEYGIKVTIRLNVDDNNRTDLYNLIDYLYKEIPNKENISIYAANLFDTDHTRSIDENTRLNNELYKMNDYISKKGFRKKLLDSLNNISNGCMAQNPNSVVISPTGELGKCEQFYNGDKLFGSIYTDKIEQKSIDYWMQAKRLSECETCLVYPSCYGITNCPNESGKCGQVERYEKIHNIEECMVGSYYKFMNT